MRALRLHVAEEPELRKAPYLAKMLLVLLIVLLVEKDLESH